jgi:hypothetical protein
MRRALRLTRESPLNALSPAGPPPTIRTSYISPVLCVGTGDDVVDHASDAKTALWKDKKRILTVMVELNTYNFLRMNGSDRSVEVSCLFEHHANMTWLIELQIHCTRNPE